MLEDKAAVGARFSQIRRRGEAAQLRLGKGSVTRRRGRIAREAGEFEERRTHDRRRRGIARRVGLTRRVEIPIRDFIRRQARMIHDEARDFFRGFQVADFAGFTKHHRVTIKTPRLAARPSGTIRRALMRDAAQHAAGGGIIIHDVKSATVGPEMIRQRSVRVRDRDIPEPRFTAVARGPGQQFEVHQIINDDRKGVFLGAAVPRFDGADHGRKARGQGLRAFEQHGAIGRVAGEPQAVAVTAV